MKMSRKYKSFLALFLVLSMTMSLVSDWGNTVAQAKTKKKAADKLVEKQLKKELSDMTKVYPKGAFSFYKGQLTATEGKSAQLVLVRKGSTKKAGNVSFKAVDVSAKYGEDYLITVHDGSKKKTLKKTEDKPTLLEQYGPEMTKEGVVSVDDIEDDSKEPQQTAASEETETSEKEYSDLDRGAQALSGKVGTEKTWREVDASRKISDEETVESLIAGGKKDTLKAASLLEGVSYTFHFKKGEYKKVIDISVLDDSISEIDEQVMFMLYDAKGSEMGDLYTAYLNILDNEEYEPSTFAVANKSIKVRRGQPSVDIVVNRTTGFDQMASVEVCTSELTAKPGQDYVAMSESLTFAPGMKSQTATIPLAPNVLVEGERSFHVGLMSESDIVDSKANATLVTITNSKDVANVSYEVKKVKMKTADSTSAKQEKLFESSNTYVGTSNQEKTIEVEVAKFANKTNLKNASQLKVTLESKNGSSEYKDGCDKRKSSKRKIQVQIKRKDKDALTTIYEEETDAFSSKTITTTDGKLDWDTQMNADKVIIRVSGGSHNNNTDLRVSKIEGIYPAHTISFNNMGLNSEGKVANPNNVYQEKNITGTNKDNNTTKEYIKLGGLRSGDENSQTVYHPEEVNVEYFFGSGDPSVKVKNSVGVEPSSANTEFVRYQIKNDSEINSWDDLGTVKIDNKDLLMTMIKNRSDKEKTTSSFILRPVFKVKDASVQFVNDDTSKGHYKNVASDNGSLTTVEVKGLKDKQNIKMLDSISISAYPEKGQNIKAINLIDANGQPIEGAKAGTNNVTAGFKSSNFIKSVLAYQEAAITVQTDKKGLNTDKGTTFYTGSSSAETKGADGVKTTKFQIKGISLFSKYNILGMTKDNSKNGYVPVWRDGTLDTNDDGEITDDEKKANPDYQEFTPVTGSVLELVPNNTGTKVYYQFEERAPLSESKAARLMGRVSLTDKVLFTGKTSTNYINGVNVSADNDTAVTNTQSGQAGYFEMKGKNTYAVKDYMLVNVSYAGEHGSSIVGSYVMNPGYYKEVNLYTNSILDVDSSIVEKEENENEIIDLKPTYKPIDYKAICNDDANYRLSFHITGGTNNKNGVVVAKKATLRFYNSAGNEISDAKQTITIKDEDSGWAKFVFNPQDLCEDDAGKSMQLPAGSTMKLQLEDQNGKTYYERETGIMVTQDIGALDVLSSFNFGAANAVVKLLGTIDSAIGVEWEGTQDKGEEGLFRYTTEDETDEGKFKSFVIGYRFGKKEKDNSKPSLRDIAGDKAEAEVAQMKASDAVINFQRDPNKTAEENDKAEAKLNKALEEANSNLDKAKDAYSEKVGEEATKKKEKTKLVASVSVQFTFAISITFKLDEKGGKDGKGAGRYYFKNLVIGVSAHSEAKVEKQFLVPCGVTISFGVKASVDGEFTGVYEQRVADVENPVKYYVVSGDEKVGTGEKSLRDGEGKINLGRFFDGNSENRDFDAYGRFRIKPGITFYAGASIFAGVAKVNVSGGADFNLEFFFNKSGDNGSVQLNAAIEVELLFGLFTHEWPYKSDKIDLFGGSTSSADKNHRESYLYESTNIMTPDQKGYLKNRGNWNANAMTTKSLDENPNGVKEAELLKNVYNGTDIKVQPINNAGDYLGVFLDDSVDANGNLTRDKYNASTVKYTIYDHASKQWSVPVEIEGDDTQDQNLNMYDLGDRGIIVTWSTPTNPYTANMSKVDMLNQLNIHGVFFNKATKSFSPIMKITKDTELVNAEAGNDDFADINANVSYDEATKTLVMFYTKNAYAVSDASEGEVVGDALNPTKSYVAYREYHFDGATGINGKWIDKYDQLNGASESKSAYNKFKDAYGDAFDDFETAFYGQVWYNIIPPVYLEEELDDVGYWKDNKEPKVHEGYQVVGSVKTQEDGSGVIVSDTSEVKGNQAVVSVPTIVEKDSISYNGLSLNAYVVDYDNSMSTVNDRNVYVDIFDFAKGTLSNPIMVTSDKVVDANVKFTRVRSSKDDNYEATYLTWLSNGNIVGLDISNVIKNCLIEKTAENGEKYDIIDKSSDSKYIPVTTYVEGDVDKDADGAISDISSYDVSSSDGYVYLGWTEKDRTVNEGIEEGSDAAQLAKNQNMETQIHMARFDIHENTMTKDVQVTSGKGANYSNVSFQVDDTGKVKALATKSKSILIDKKAFNESLKANNGEDTALVGAKDDFAEYVATDTDNISLVTLDITPTSVMKVRYVNEEGRKTDGIDLAGLKQGTENTTDFIVYNDGIDTLKNATLTATNSAGQSVLVKQSAKDNTMTGEKVNSIVLDQLVGGDSYTAGLSIPMAERQMSEAITIKIVAQNGDELYNQTFKKTLEEYAQLYDLKVEETSQRDVYDVSMILQNGSHCNLSDKTVAFGITTKNGNVTLATVHSGAMYKGESKRISARVKVDSTKQFVSKTNSDGSVVETGSFYGALGSEVVKNDVVRKATAEQMKYIKAVTGLSIYNGAAIQVKKGKSKIVRSAVKSSLANKSNGYNGDEGVQVILQSSNRSIFTAENSGTLIGVNKGTAAMYAYVLPRNVESVATVNEESSKDPNKVHNYAVDTSYYTSAPNAAIKRYSVNVSVGDGNGTNSQTNVVTKGGVSYKISGSTVTVTKLAGKKSITIPSTVTINNKKYPVTSIAANAASGLKSLTKVVIGKNVKSIGKNAFKNCKKLKSIIFKCKKVKIGSNAFKGIHKKAVFKTPKGTKKKYKKLLTKKKGFVKKTMRIK